MCSGLRPRLCMASEYDYGIMSSKSRSRNQERTKTSFVLEGFGCLHLTSFVTFQTSSLTAGLTFWSYCSSCLCKFKRRQGLNSPILSLFTTVSFTFSSYKCNITDAFNWTWPLKQWWESQSNPPDSTISLLLHRPQQQ